MLKPEKFYNRMAKHYDKFMECGESTLEDEVALVLLTFPTPCKMLDVGCGTGRVSLELQKKGYDITGLDISQKMVDVASGKGLEKTIVGDFAYIETYEKFDGIISLHTGFSYVNEEEIMRKMIKKCINILTEGGVVLWDTPNEDFYGKEKVLEWPAGEEILRTTCYGHDVNKLKSLFIDEGFAIKQIWGSYTPLRKFESGLPRIIIEGKKNG